MSDESTSSGPSVAPEQTGRAPYERADRAEQKRGRRVRLGVLIASLVTITVLGYIHQLGAPFKVIGVDALCPFGGIETLWSLIAGGTLIQKIATSSVIILIGTIAMALVLKRSFCGYICPLGALQELFGKIGNAIWRKGRPTLPASIDRPARYLKYVVFAVFAVWTWQAATLVIRPYDPWVAYMHLTSAEVLAEFGIGLAVLGVSLVGSVLYDRFFCKYLCPMGAFLGLISRFSLFKVRREASVCIDCGACDKACPMNIEVSGSDPTVTSAECINCNECVNACPVKGALEVSTASTGPKRATLQPKRALGISVAIMVALVAVTTAAGAFAWTLPGLAPAKATAEGGEGGAAPVPDVNVDDIKGSMTLDEVIAATTIPAAKFEERFGITASETAEKIKDLASAHSFDVHGDFRDFVSQTLDDMRAAAAAPVPASSVTTSTESAGD